MIEKVKLANDVSESQARARKEAYRVSYNSNSAPIIEHDKTDYLLNMSRVKMDTVTQLSIQCRWIASVSALTTANKQPWWMNGKFGKHTAVHHRSYFCLTSSSTCLQKISSLVWSTSIQAYTLFVAMPFCSILHRVNWVDSCKRFQTVSSRIQAGRHKKWT